MKIGFIGLGEQGAPIVERLIKTGWPLHLWARRAQAAEPLVRQGARLLATPKALGEECDYVGICVMADDDVRQVVLGSGDGVLFGMKPGGIIVIHSTVLPDTMRELDREARARNLQLIDAPVTGRASGALAGTMTIMVGGEVEAFEHAGPVLRSFGAKIFLLGPIGSGQLCKLLCNNVCFANQALGLSAIDLAVELGMGREVASQVLAVSAGASTGLTVALERLREFGRMRPGSAMPKDQRHFREILMQNGITDHLIERLSARAVKVMRAEEP
jgi:3-hydroxyisobutyrate dehydrogenase-like beta-hydroxyacid dehydrogenase